MVVSCAEHDVSSCSHGKNDAAASAATNPRGGLEKDARGSDKIDDSGMFRKPTGLPPRRTKTAKKTPVTGWKIGTLRKSHTNEALPGISVTEKVDHTKDTAMDLTINSESKVVNTVVPETNDVSTGKSGDGIYFTQDNSSNDSESFSGSVTKIACKQNLEHTSHVPENAGFTHEKTNTNKTIKDTLKLTIQKKRKEYGLGELTVEPEQPRQYEMTEEEKDKDRRRRESNRKSALLSRKRQKEDEELYQKLYDELHDKNMDLDTAVKKMEREKRELIAQLRPYMTMDEITNTLKSHVKNFSHTANATQSVKRIISEPDSETTTTATPARKRQRRNTVTCVKDLNTAGDRLAQLAPVRSISMDYSKIQMPTHTNMETSTKCEESVDDGERNVLVASKIDEEESDSNESLSSLSDSSDQESPRTPSYPSVYMACNTQTERVTVTTESRECETSVEVNIGNQQTPKHELQLTPQAIVCTVDAKQIRHAYTTATPTILSPCVQLTQSYNTVVPSIVIQQPSPVLVIDGGALTHVEGEMVISPSELPVLPVNAATATPSALVTQAPPTMIIIVHNGSF